MKANCTDKHEIGGSIPDSLKRAFVTGGAGFIGWHLLDALHENGVDTVALARNAGSASRVAELQATVFRGDLHNVETLAEALKGCDTIFHVGQYLADWDMDTAMRENVEGSRNLAAAARKAGVKRIVYVSGTGVTIGTGPVVQIDETRPRGKPVGVLCASRVRSEEAMLAENRDGLEVVVTRFPYVYGPGETLTPALRRAVEAGRFRWINGGRHLISILHVSNAVDGMLLAATLGRPGEIYWFTDGAPMVLKDFFEAHLRAIGLPSPEREISFARARRIADSMFTIWRLLRIKSAPPLTPTLVRFMGQEITVVDTKARRELGYRPDHQWAETRPDVQLYA